MFGGLNLAGLIPSLVQTAVGGGDLGSVLTGGSPNANGGGLDVSPAQASRDLEMPFLDQFTTSVLPQPTGLTGVDFPVAPNRNNFVAPQLFGAPLDFQGAAQATSQPQSQPQGNAPAPQGDTRLADLLLQLTAGGK